MTENIPNLPENWTYSHAVVFVFYTFATVTDGELSKSEVEELMQQCANWGIPVDTFEEANAFFFSGMTYGHANTWATRMWLSITKELDSDSLGTMVQQLKKIANADGTVTAGEASTLAWFESTLESAKV